MTIIKEPYPAIVSNTDDPLKRGRIKVKCVQLSGDPDKELIGWIDPCLDWGWFYVPDVDEEVEIEAVASDGNTLGVPRQAFIESARLRWRGKRFQSEQGDEPRLPHDFFKTNYGKRRGFFTPLGHVLYFDDTPGSEEVTITWTNEANDAYSFLTFDKNGSILLNSSEGAALFMDAPNKTTTLSAEKNLLVMSPSGIQAIDQFSNVIEMKDGLVQVLSQGDVVVNAGANATVIAKKAKVEADEVELKTDSAKIGDGADSPFVRHTEWEAYNNSHTHPTAFGPSGPPIVPALPTIASTKATVK